MAVSAGSSARKCHLVEGVTATQITQLFSGLLLGVGHSDVKVYRDWCLERIEHWTMGVDPLSQSGYILGACRRIELDGAGDVLEASADAVHINKSSKIGLAGYRHRDVVEWDLHGVSVKPVGDLLTGSEGG